MRLLFALLGGIVLHVIVAAVVLATTILVFESDNSVLTTIIFLALAIFTLGSGVLVGNIAVWAFVAHVSRSPRLAARLYTYPYMLFTVCAFVAWAKLPLSGGGAAFAILVQLLLLMTSLFARNQFIEHGELRMESPDEEGEKGEGTPEAPQE